MIYVHCIGNGVLIRRGLAPLIITGIMPEQGDQLGVSRSMWHGRSGRDVIKRIYHFNIKFFTDSHAFDILI